MVEGPCASAGSIDPQTAGWSLLRHTAPPLMSRYLLTNVPPLSKAQCTRTSHACNRQLELGRVAARVAARTRADHEVQRLPLLHPERHRRQCFRVVVLEAP